MIDLSARLDAFTDDERLIRDAASHYCSNDANLDRVRRLRGALPSYEASAWQEMAEMGWLGCRVPEPFGGMGLSAAQASLLLEQYGRSLAPEPLTACAILTGAVLLGATNEALKQRLLTSLVSGEWIGSVAWQESAGQMAAGAIQCTVASESDARDASVVLNGTKRFVPVAESADAFIVSANGAQGLALYVVERHAPGLAITTHKRIDGGTWSDLTLVNVRLTADALLASGSAASSALEHALDEARLAISAELVGLMSHVFDLTVDYVKVREQFGKQISSFQVIQHRAVDQLVLVELARAVLRQSAARFDAAAFAEQRAMAASQAKARTSDAAIKVAKACIQMHGGIAYTDECNIGMFLKRAMVMAAWLGSASAHRTRYGTLMADNSGTLDDTTPSAAPTDPLLAEVRQFLQQHFPPEWRFPSTRMSMKATHSFLSKVAEKGWTAPGWPREYGGMGLSAYDQIGFNAEFDRHGISIVTNLGVSMLGPLLIRYGTDAQKRRYLPPLAAGTERWSQGYSEPGAGSDLASLRTRADLDGDHFVVNGQKIWTSFAQDADMLFLLARTDGEAKKQGGISFLLVDMRSPGITVRPIRNLTGESEFCEVFFDNVRVPRENLVGEINRGWTMAKSLLGSERITIGSPRLAEYPLQIVRQLMITNGVWDDPVTRARFDELRLDVDDLGAAFVRVANVLRRGGEVGAEVSMLKVWISEAAQRVTDLMLDLQGEQASIDAAAPLADGTSVHVANQYFLSRPMTIYGGSSEIQRNILAKAVLDLPG